MILQILCVCFFLILVEQALNIDCENTSFSLERIKVIRTLLDFRKEDQNFTHLLLVFDSDS